MIKEGEIFPNIKISLVGTETKEIEANELFANKKIILFAVPGAFTPTCNNSHLPSFLETREICQHSLGTPRVKACPSG